MSMWKTHWADTMRVIATAVIESECQIARLSPEVSQTVVIPGKGPDELSSTRSV